MKIKRYPFVLMNLGNLGDAIISGLGIAYYGTWVEMNQFAVALWDIHPLFMLFFKIFVVAIVSLLIYRVSKGLVVRIYILHYALLILSGVLFGICVSNCLYLLSLGQIV